MSRHTVRWFASSLLVTGLLILGWSVPALAGGWAVITLDELSGKVIAGQEFEIGFTVLQHGNQDAPVEGLTPTVKAVPASGGNSISFPVREDKNTRGHYLAVLNLPEAGEWEWSIAAFNMNQVIPALTVVEGAPAAEAPASAIRSGPVWLGVVGLLGFAAGLVANLRRRSSWTAAFTLSGLGCIILAIGLGFSQTPVPAQAAKVAVDDGSASLEQLGHDLFVAKGCLNCHRNNRVDEKYFVFSTEIGPDLTNHPLGEEYLGLWLKDPRSAKPGTQMPNLGLKATEIEALIAFLNDVGE